MTSYYLEYNVDAKEWHVEDSKMAEGYSSHPRMGGSEDETYICCYNPSIEEGKKKIYTYMLNWIRGEREYLNSLEAEAKNFIFKEVHKDD